MFGFGKNDDRARDPVCGMKVDKNKTQFSYVGGGKTFYFCSQNCKDTFLEDIKKGNQNQGKKGGCC